MAKIKLSHKNGRYEVRCSFEDRLTVQEIPGLFWDSRDKLWVTYSEKSAYALIDFADDETKARLLKMLGLSEPSEVDLSRVLTHPENMKPFKVQLEGVEFILSRNNSYIAFEQGLGKTAIAIMASNHLKGQVLIVCPTFLKKNWEREIKTWTTKRGAKICIMETKKSEIDLAADYLIVPYSLVSTPEIMFKLLESTFSLLVLDESHYCKNQDSQTARAVFGGDFRFYEPKATGGRTQRSKKVPGIYSRAEKVVCLSGTPLPNRYMDIFIFCKKLAPESIAYMNRHQFGVKYCGAFETPYGWSYAGSTNGDELATRLKKNFMLVKRIADCIDLPPVLPPKVISLAVSGNKKAFKVSGVEILNGLRLPDVLEFEASKNDSFKSKFEALKERLKKNDKNPNDSSFMLLSEIRRLQGIAKVKPSADVISELLDFGPLVVFAYHTEVIEELTRELSKYKPLVITGKTKNRQEVVDTFQTSRDHNLIICQIKAAGVGLTLTKSATVVFAEWSWQHAENEQAASRCRRIGQTQPFERIYLSVDGSIDSYILNNNLKKDVAISKVVK